LAATSDQDAWGNVLASTATGAWASSFEGRHLFALPHDPDSGLYRFPQRPYDPRVGRFIRPSSPYTLTKNNPTDGGKKERKDAKECGKEAQGSDKDAPGACNTKAERTCRLIQQCMIKRGYK
jgi:hypothetical protein